MSKDILYPLRKLHGRWNEYRRFRQQFLVPFKLKKRQNGKCVFLVMTPEHTNLGDHAIAIAAIQLLNNANVAHVEITYDQLFELRANGLLGILNKHPILINGGGNLGTLWFNVEELMRDIVTSNPKSPIMILPNTVYYENSDWGNEELQRTRQIYNGHRNLTIYAREQISYNMLQKHFHHVKLVPDLVMSLNESHIQHERNGCLVCLRKDREKTISEVEETMLKEGLTSIFQNNITYSDTHAVENVSIEERPEALKRKFDEFRGAELVVTDRLHGMVFCAITGTPCIVINSQSPKVKGCYEWIKHLAYIRFCDDVNNIDQVYEGMPRKICNYDNTQLLPYYQELSEDILKII